MSKKIYRFPVIIERDADGYFVQCPDLEGCFTQGDTYEEALKNIQEAIELCLEDDRARDGENPAYKNVSYSTVEMKPHLRQNGIPSARMRHAQFAWNRNEVSGIMEGETHNAKTNHATTLVKALVRGSLQHPHVRDRAGAYDGCGSNAR